MLHRCSSTGIASHVNVLELTGTGTGTDPRTGTNNVKPYSLTMMVIDNVNTTGTGNIKRQHLEWTQVKKSDCLLPLVQNSRYW